MNGSLHLAIGYLLMELENICRGICDPTMGLVVHGLRNLPWAHVACVRLAVMTHAIVLKWSK